MGFLSIPKVGFGFGFVVLVLLIKTIRSRNLTLSPFHKSTQNLIDGTLEKLKTLTLKGEEEEQTTAVSFQFPNEIMQEILSRLPIKPILRFRSVSKQWLSLISHDPSFPKLHYTRSLTANRTALLITAYDPATKKLHLLSAPPDGGPVTHLVTFDNAPYQLRAHHLNGLVLFTPHSFSGKRSLSFVVNPATHKIFKLPIPGGCSYFFGFHQSRNEHYVLSIKKPFSETTNSNVVEFMIYSLSTYSWRKIEINEEEFPLDITGNPWLNNYIVSLCVNSVIYLMLIHLNKILAFDLTTDKFSTLDIPQDAIPHERYTMLSISLGVMNVKLNHPYLIDIDGCLGLVSDDRVVERNELYLWKLQDYDGRVWVRKTATFSESWIDLNSIDSASPIYDMDKIVFSVRRVSSDEVTVPIYDIKTKDLKLVQCTLGPQFLHSDTIKFGKVRSYVESILPLEKNEEGLHGDDNQVP